MELGKSLDSIGQFELEASRFVDGSTDMHLIINFRCNEDKSDLIDPLTAVFSLDLEIAQDIFWFEGIY